MLRHVLFDMSLFENESDRENSQKRVLWLLEALTRCNQLYLQEHPDTPLIYKSGITYKLPAQFEQEQLPEVSVVEKYLKDKGAPSDVMEAFTAMANQLGGGEHFREIPRIIENGGGDCDNLAAWRCAELRELGVNAKPYITWRRRPDGGMTYHVVVRWPDGSSEDPSLLLKMGFPNREPERLEEERKLGERTGSLLAGDPSFLGVPKRSDVLGLARDAGLLYPNKNIDYDDYLAKKHQIQVFGSDRLKIRRGK